MPNRGLHMALTDEELRELLALPVEDRTDHIGEELEESKCGTPDGCETDKAWAFIKSALEDEGSGTQSGILGKLLGKSRSENYAQFAILGQEEIAAEDGYYIGLVRSAVVPSVATELEKISPEQIGE